MLNAILPRNAVLSLCLRVLRPACHATNHIEIAARAAAVGYPFMRVRIAGFAASLALMLGALLPSIAHAQSSQPAPQPSGMLTLDAHANSEVPVDVIRIQMFYEEQGNDPGMLAANLNQRTSAALQAAKAQDIVKVKTGSFSISPSTDRDGKISGWRGRSEIELSSRDFAAASHLAGQLSGGGKLQVAGVQFSLSPEALQKAESGLTKEAIANFQQQAKAAAEAFGYNGFTVREVNLGYAGMMQPQRMLRSFAAMGSGAAKIDASIPVEAGTTTVTVNVSGSVQMTR